MFNFKKISAIGASALMVGMSAGFATAANYPAPFIVGGAADVAVVYGTGSGVSVLDAIEAGNIQSNLQSWMGSGTSSSTTTSTSGETVALDTGATRIWLNTSLNTARTSITKTELPTVLADTSFSGNVDATLTHTVKLVGGAAAGDDNSGKVIFSKQPKSNIDPVIGISLGTSGSSNPLYNATVTMKAINFSKAESEGGTITLFGREYVVSTATDATDLVLFSSAEEVTLTKTSGENPTATVSVGGTDYTVGLLNGDSASATVEIDGESKDITEGKSKKIGGVDVAVKSVTSSDVAGITATLLVGTEKVTLTHGSTVKKGSDDDSISGTLVYVTGTAGDRPGTATEIAIAVFRPDSSNDAILEGDTFVDPVWGSFKLDFVGLSSPLDDASRDTIEVLTSGDDTMTVTMTDNDGNKGTFEFAHNQSSVWRLMDDSNKTIYTYEHANVSEDEYIVVGNEDYGHLLLVETLTNSTSTDDHTKHTITLRDVISNVAYEPTMTSHTDGYFIIDGKQYDLNFSAVSGGTHRIQLKYPQADSPSGDDFVVYPTMKTQRGALVALYEPLTINLTSWPQDVSPNPGAGIGNKRGITPARFYFPDGDGYTSVAIAYSSFIGGAGNVWDIGGNAVNISTDAAKSNYTTSTIGQLTYNWTQNADGGNDGAGVANTTHLFLTDPRPGQSALIDQPALIIFEGKDDNNAYEAVVIDLESDPGGSSTNGAGVNDIFYSTPYYTAAASRSSDSDFEEEIDWWGTHITSDSSDSDQKVATISYPSDQVYAQIYLGGESSEVTASGTTSSATQLGDVLVKDSEVSSVSSKNLVVVGGSCINSVAADLLGGSDCGAGFTEKTGVGSGEFLIESFDRDGKVALLVAGYEVSDTVNAAKYLRTQTVDTAVGMKYKGTTATNAELVTTTG